MKLLVSGSSGHLARVLLPRLCAHPQVEELHGLDRRPAVFRHPCYRHHVLDIRDPAVGQVAADCDAVIHLAFVVQRGALGRRRRDRALMAAVNREGTANLFQAAARAGVRRAVHLSSAAVYGAWPDNPPRIREDRPLRPNPGFAYAEDKAAVEHWLETFAARYPELSVAVLRPHASLGRNALPLLRALLRLPFYPHLGQPLPLTQCVWEEDVAEAVLAALQRDVSGAFNLAAEPALPFRDLQRHLHRFPLPVPPSLARFAVRGLWLFTGAAGEPAWLEGMRHSLALDCGRARRELSWQPSATVYDCLRRTLA